MNTPKYSKNSEDISILPEQKEFSFEEGFDRLFSFVVENYFGAVSPFLIKICGGTNSGKTYLAQKLTEEVKKVLDKDDILLISMDDYYKDISDLATSPDAKFDEVNWDVPSAVKLESLSEHLTALLQGDPIEKPEYSFAENRQVGTTTIHSKKLIICEGNYLNHHDIKVAEALSVFIDTPLHISGMRKIARDLERTKNRTAQELYDYFHQKCIPMYNLHVESTKGKADFVILNQHLPTHIIETVKKHQLEHLFKAIET